MRLAVLAAVPFALGTSVPALAVSETAEGFAAAMQGCWTQTRWGPEIEELREDPEFTIAAGMCLKGGITGDLETYYCDGRPQIDCWDQQDGYEFKDEKFWRYFADETPAGQMISCDVRLVPGQWLELHACVGHAADGSVVGSPDDALYQRRVD